MNIGYFVECRGLAVEVEVHEYAEGGNNEFVHQLPGRLIYPKLELARGMTDRGQPPELVHADARQGRAQGTDHRHHNRYGEVHRSFTFDEAYPVKWSGPTIAVAGGGAAVEELRSPTPG